MGFVFGLCTIKYFSFDFHILRRGIHILGFILRRYAISFSVWIRQ